MVNQNYDGMIPFIKWLLHPADNINHVAWHYARTIGLKVTRESLRKGVDGHPDYPSLLALSDVFNSFGADTVAVRVNNEQLAELDQPYITQIKFDDRSAPVFTVARPHGPQRLSYLQTGRSKRTKVFLEELMEGRCYFRRTEQQIG